MTSMAYEDVAADQLDALLADDRWAAEPKLDGMRCLAEIHDGTVRLLNRNGVKLDAGGHANKRRVEEAIAGLGLLGDWILDGEIIGDRYHIFDLVEGVGGVITRETPFARRREALELLATLVDLETAHLSLVPHARGTDAKRTLLAFTEQTDGEGIMLKRLDATYSTGRRHGDGFRHKLTKTLDLEIMALRHNGKDAVLVGGLDPATGNLVPVGGVTSIGKGPLAVGDIVEIRCLRVTENGKMIQPRIVRKRTDKSTPEILTVVPA